MNIKVIVAATLSLIIASTSLASAGGVKIIELPKPKKSDVVIDPSHPKPIDIPGGSSGGPKKPVIIIDPSNPKPIDIPVNGGPDAGGGSQGSDNPNGTPLLAIACAVVEPLGNTDHFWIVNAGDTALPVGLKVRYRVPATGDHGAFALPKQVAIGGKLMIPNLLHNAPDGAPCDAKII